MRQYTFKEKRHHFDDLLAEQHLESDIALLNKLQPNASASFGHLSGIKLAKEVLYLLLDYATREDIIDNRRSAGKDTTGLIVMVKDLILSILGKSKTEALAIKEQVEGLIVELPEEDVDTLLDSLESVMATIKDDSNGEGKGDGEGDPEDGQGNEGTGSDKDAETTGTEGEDSNVNPEVPEQAPNADDAVNGEGNAAPESAVDSTTEKTKEAKPSGKGSKGGNEQKKSTSKKTSTQK